MEVIDQNENKENSSITGGHNKRHEEFQYLDQIRHIFNTGCTKSDRTGVGTKSVFIYNFIYCLWKLEIMVLLNKGLWSILEIFFEK